jgi:hypothetical protein
MSGWTFYTIFTEGQLCGMADALKTLPRGNIFGALFTGFNYRLPDGRAACAIAAAASS